MATHDSSLKVYRHILKSARLQADWLTIRSPPTNAHMQWSDRLTKHSAASSIRPSWKRSSESKVSAIALRIASGGTQRSSPYWNCVNITCRVTDHTHSWRRTIQNQFVQQKPKRKNNEREFFFPSAPQLWQTWCQTFHSSPSKKTNQTSRNDRANGIVQLTNWKQSSSKWSTWVKRYCAC